jgi:atrial natriuretic peptide receptor A
VIARKAFESLLRVSLLQPTSPRFNTFADNVREIAKNEYNYEFFEGEEVNFFIGAFYDGEFLNLIQMTFAKILFLGVLLLGMVLNETLTEKGDILDGVDITRRM